jgi:hypothetical protein
MFLSPKHLLPLLLILTGTTQAWWDGGHKLSGYIAYEDLDQEHRDWVMHLLESHPTHQELFVEPLIAEFADTADETTRQQWYFGQATVWADLVRNSYGYTNAKEISATYSHAERHYTDFPIFADETSRQKLRHHDKPPLTTWRPGMKEPNDKLNSMQAFQKIYREVPDPKIPIATRAVELTWLFHLVGDTHQPCHCAQLFHHEKLPDGDRGANATMIFGLKSQSDGMRGDVVHAFWDSLHGGDAAKSHQAILDLHSALKKKTELWERARAAITVTSPLDWLKEGHQLASEYVYPDYVRFRINNAKTETITRNSRTLGTRTEHVVNISLPAAAMEQYVRQARQVADQQIIIAGLRLAESIRQLKAKQP